MPKRADELPDNVQDSDSPDTGDADKDELIRRRQRFSDMQTFWSGVHEKAVKDDDFVAGDQWPDEIKKDREEEGRPVLTYNQLPSMTRQIINKVRQDRPQLRIKPVESDRAQTPDVSNVQGTQDYSLADVYMGLWRNMEHISKADDCYDTSITHATNHGFGFFMLNTRYCRNDPFVQEIYMQRVKNSYTVYLDPSANDAVYADMQDAFVFSKMSKSAFEAKYPDARVASFEQGNAGVSYEGWYDKEGVTVATYWWVDWVDDEVVKMNNGKIHYFSLVKDVLDDMKRDQGVYILSENGKELRKKVKRPVVKWQKMSALEFLSEPHETVFEQVPIFPVLGEEIVVEGNMEYKSAIRDAIDAQRSYNYHRTSAAETVGLQPKAPFVGTERQFAGHEDQWENANRENQPYLTYNHVEGVAMPQRQPPPQSAGAELVNAQQDLADMRYIVGIQEADLGVTSNEKSGKAILARQSQGLTSTFTFPDNLNRAIEQAGRCFVDAAPRIIDTARVLRIRLPDDTEDFVEINKMERDDATGKVHLVHDLAYGKYDVAIDTGPSYQTQREEAVESMLELLGVLPPELAQLVVHLIVQEMAFPGADKVAAILRKALPEQFKSEEEKAADLPKGVIFDKDGEPVYEATGEPYQAPPTPETQAQQAAADAEKEKQTAERTKHEATIKTAEAKMAEAQFKMAELQQPSEGGEMDYTSMLPQIQQIVDDGFAKHAEDPNAHKGAIEVVMAEAAVDILKRVKRYVDGETAKITPAEEEVTPTEEASSTQETSATVVQLPVAKRLKIENVQRDDETGRITGGEVVVIEREETTVAPDKAAG